MCGLFGFACDVTGYLGSKVRVKVLAIRGRYALCRTADRSDKGRTIAVPVERIKVEPETQVMTDVEVYLIERKSSGRVA